METKHTPGEWFAVQGILSDQPTVWDVTDGPSGMFIATVHEAADEPSARANAALIASAPELLEALQNLLMHCGIADAAPEDKDDIDHRYERAARAAIARATASTGGR